MKRQLIIAVFISLFRLSAYSQGNDSARLYIDTVKAVITYKGKFHSVKYSDGYLVRMGALKIHNGKAALMAPLQIFAFLDERKREIKIKKIISAK